MSFTRIPEKPIRGAKSLSCPVIRKQDHEYALCSHGLKSSVRVPPCPKAVLRPYPSPQRYRPFGNPLERSIIDYILMTSDQLDA